MFTFFTKSHRFSTKTTNGVILFVVFALLFVFPLTPIVQAQQTQLVQTQEERAKLQSELAALEAEIAQKQKELDSQKGQSQTLTNDIARLRSQVNTAKLNIQAKNLTISKLSGEISEKSTEIKDLSSKIENQKESLAQLIRHTRSFDGTNLIDLLLSQNSISEFYNDITTFDSIKSAIKQSVTEVRGLKNETESVKQLLEKKQDEERDARAAIEKSKQQIEKNQAAQNQLLSISKNKEKEYQAILADRAAKVSAIRAKLFSLAGGSSAIRFDVALQYAEAASVKTGVAPALVLAILTQESSLGANAGRCFLSDLTSGSGYNPTTGRTFTNVIKPNRDLLPFIDITTRLGLDPLKTPVSCPIPSAGGFGSAMGPAQFIASTWKIFEKRLKTALGREANPWIAEDAFLASAMYLADLGAVGDSPSKQIRAACSYYGTRGATCNYGNSVMRLKNAIQADIDYLKEYGISRR